MGILTVAEAFPAQLVAKQFGVEERGRETACAARLQENSAEALHYGVRLLPRIQVHWGGLIGRRHRSVSCANSVPPRKKAGPLRRRLRRCDGCTAVIVQGVLERIGTSSMTHKTLGQPAEDLANCPWHTSIEC